jgi:hypothetical protein
MQSKGKEEVQWGKLALWIGILFIAVGVFMFLCPRLLESTASSIGKHPLTYWTKSGFDLYAGVIGIFGVICVVASRVKP